MAAMEMTIPDHVLESSDLSATEKLVYAVHISNPQMSKSNIGRLLKIHRTTVQRAILNAKKCSTHATHCSTHATLCSTHATKCSTHATPVAPTLHVSSSSSIEEGKPEERKTPTKKEVERFACQMKRHDLFEEFFDHYEENEWMHNGEPLSSWRSMFRAWARYRKPVTEPSVSHADGGSPRTFEEARYMADQSY